MDPRMVLGDWLGMAYQTGFDHASRMDGRKTRRLTDKEKMLVAEGLRACLANGSVRDYRLAQELLALLSTVVEIVAITPGTN